jgi:hypothetical protein
VEKEIKIKRAVFTEAELDYLLCAIIKQQTEFRSRIPIMERFAAADHLANHRAKIALGERLLEELS